mmetsp:Transcript_59769/g.164558  ORF Transcript_59769/g.164558 Transcript_59769/m.164558 type:complete len:226 (-) Transcript_59769:233-910(-)
MPAYVSDTGMRSISFTASRAVSRTSPGRLASMHIERNTSMVRRMIRQRSPWSREVDEHSSAQSQPLAHDSTRPESTGLRLTGWSTPSLNCKSMRSDAIGSSSSTTPITGTEGPYRVNVSGRVYSVMIDETREASSGALRRRTAGESSTCANHSSLSALIDAIKLPKSLGRPSSSRASDCCSAPLTAWNSCHAAFLPRLALKRPSFQRWRSCRLSSFFSSSSRAVI